MQCFYTRSCNVCLLSQGALTHGDRRATESRDLSKYNFENKVSLIWNTYTDVNLNQFWIKQQVLIFLSSMVAGL